MTSISLIFPPKHPPMEADESCAGYVARLAEINRYPAKSWMFAGRKIVKPGAMKTLRHALQEASWCQADFSHPDYAHIDGVVGRSHSISRKLRYCVLCMRCNPYHRTIWQDRFYCICLEHQCWMIDTCHVCSKRLNAMEDGNTKCQCGADFREAKPTFAKDDMASLTAFALGKDAEPRDDEFDPNIYDLSITQRRRLIRFFSRWAIIGRGPIPNISSFVSTISLAQQSYSGAAAVIFGDQNGLDSLLQSISHYSLFQTTQKRGKDPATAFICGFNTQFPEPFLDSTRKLIGEYLLQFSKQRIDRRVAAFTDEDIDRYNWVSRERARRKSKLSQRRFDWLISTDKVRRHYFDEGEIGWYLVSYRDIDNYLKTFSDFLYPAQVCAELGIRDSQFDMLSAANLIGTPAYLPRGKVKSPHFSKSDIESFKDLFRSQDSPLQDTISIGEILDLYYGIDRHFLVAIVSAIKSGVLLICRPMRFDSILDACVSQSEFNSWFSDAYSSTLSIPIEQLTEAWKVTRHVIAKMHRDGLLSVSIHNNSSLQVSIPSLLEFNRQFVLARRLWRHIDITFAELAEDLEAKNIFSVDETSNFTMFTKIYHRDEVAPLLDVNTSRDFKLSWLKRRASFRTWLPHSKKARQQAFMFSDFSCGGCGSSSCSPEYFISPPLSRYVPARSKKRFRPKSITSRRSA